MVTRHVQGQAKNSICRSAPMRITKLRCRPVITKQVHSDKVRVRSQSTDQKHQEPVPGTETSTSTAQARTKDSGLSLNGLLGPWRGWRGWRSQVSLPSGSHNYKNKPHQDSYQSVQGGKEINHVSKTTLILCTKTKHIQEIMANFSSACCMDKQVISISKVINLNGSKALLFSLSTYMHVKWLASNLGSQALTEGLAKSVEVFPFTSNSLNHASIY